VRWLALVALALAGCTCDEEKPKAAASTEIPTITHETLDKLAKCQKIEKAFPPSPKKAGESEEAAMVRKMDEMAARAPDVAEACGFESAAQYAGFSFRAAVARSETSEDESLARNDSPKAAEARAATERGWLVEVDAGTMTADDLAQRRKTFAEVEKTLEQMRARRARRSGLKTLDATTLSDLVPPDSASAKRISSLAEKQPPLSDAERKSVASWKAPAP
jgi:hypothetical protein